MPVASLEDVRAALRDEKLAELLGLAECGWLDAKAGLYQLDDPAKAAELVKDVAAFANTGTGGVLLVGISTRTEHGVEILDEIRPVPRDLVDLDRRRRLVRGIIPPRRKALRGPTCYARPPLRKARDHDPTIRRISRVKGHVYANYGA